MRQLILNLFYYPFNSLFSGLVDCHKIAFERASSTQFYMIVSFYTITRLFYIITVFSLFFFFTYSLIVYSYIFGFNFSFLYLFAIAIAIVVMSALTPWLSTFISCYLLNMSWYCFCRFTSVILKLILRLIRPILPYIAFVWCLLFCLYDSFEDTFVHKAGHTSMFMVGAYSVV